VNTEVTVPAIADTLAELERIRTAPVEASELRAARDFLVGVVPLRFETPGPVVGALAGLAIHDLPDDELARYRPAIEGVSIEDVLSAAGHIKTDAAAIVLVGDADAFGAELEAAGFGRVVIERDRGPQDEGRATGVQGDLEAVDEGPAGPTEGGETPDPETAGAAPATD
jgi:hypothetical protein